MYAYFLALDSNKDCVYSSNEEFSAATAEVTEATTAITTAISIIKSPPANTKNVIFISISPLSIVCSSVCKYNIFFRKSQLEIEESYYMATVEPEIL